MGASPLRRRPAMVAMALLVLAGAGLTEPAAASTPPGPHRAAAAAPAPAPAPAPGPNEPIQVGIKPLDPFVVREAGNVHGFSIELWDEIARRNGWQTHYVWHDDLPSLLDDVAAAKVDVAIAGISITPAREARMDFSQPMFNAGLQIMTGPPGAGSWVDTVDSFFTPTIRQYFIGLVAALLLAGNLVWLFGRRRQPPDGRRGYLRGVGAGMYTAAAVGLAGDLGVGNPRRGMGRAAAVVWLIAGVCFVSVFTAAVTSQLTVRSIRSGITGVGDLPGHKVVTVAGSTAASYLAEHHIKAQLVPTIDAAYDLLEAHKAEAIVFDAPVLQHRVAVMGSNRVSVVGAVFKPEDYGIAVPVGSPLRKKINEALLQMRDDGSYERIYSHYFSTTG